MEAISKVIFMKICLMVKDKWSLLMETSIVEIMKKVLLQDLAFIFMPINSITREILAKIKWMEKGCTTSKMVINIKVNTLMGKEKDMVNTFIRMVVFLKVSGLTIKSMVKENIYSLIILITKVHLKTLWSKALANKLSKVIYHL